MGKILYWTRNQAVSMGYPYQLTKFLYKNREMPKGTLEDDLLWEQNELKKKGVKSVFVKRPGNMIALFIPQPKNLNEHLGRKKK